MHTIDCLCSISAQCLKKRHERCVFMFSFSPIERVIFQTTEFHGNHQCVRYVMDSFVFAYIFSSFLFKKMSCRKILFVMYSEMGCCFFFESVWKIFSSDVMKKYIFPYIKYCKRNNNVHIIFCDENIDEKCKHVLFPKYQHPTIE